MQISNVYVRNYRALRDISVDFYSISSLIGSNNSGKSTLFKAIDLFFDAGARVEIDDFHRRNTDEPIEIRIVFSNLTEDEAVEFASAVVDGKLSISREFTVKDSVSPNYSVTAHVFPAFSDIRSATSPSDKLAAYRSIQRDYDLRAVRSAADVDEALAAWEKANLSNWSLCQLGGSSAQRTWQTGK